MTNPLPPTIYVKWITGTKNPEDDFLMASEHPSAGAELYDLRPTTRKEQNEMKLHTKGEIERILRMYNADHDMGPDCPVTWREERLASAVLELREDLEELEMKVSALMDAVPSANRMSK